MFARRLATALLATALLGSACGSDGDEADDLDDAEPTEQVLRAPLPDDSIAPATTGTVGAAPATGVDRSVSIEPGMSWTWQLQGEIDTSVDADVYDIDLFDVPGETIAALRADDRIVVCYFSTAWEDWRDDADDWPASALGAALDDWEGERWVDVRDAGVRSVLSARLDLAVAKGCDGVEPDNVTAYRNDSGFELTTDDQLDFNRFLAAEAHRRGLSIGLKNALELIPDLVGDFDFAVNEQCVQYEECDVYAPFVDADKAVFGAEYSDEALADPDAACASAAASGVSALILPLELDGSFRIECA